MTSEQRFPLAWPASWRRTFGKKRAKFKSYGGAVTLAVAVDRLEDQLRLLGGSRLVLSTNVEVTSHGRPRSSQPDPRDTGVAAYFRLNGKDRCLACDTWDRVADNVVALALHIDAIRRIDRYGVGNVEQAFAGYTALPAQAGSWFIVLEFDEPPKSWDVIQARYRQLVEKHHPDKGGSLDITQKLGEAYATAKLEFGR